MSPAVATAVTGLLAVAGLILLAAIGSATIDIYAWYKRRKAARAGLARDAFFQSYEARLVAHWRSLTAGMSPEDAAALLDEIMADHRRRVAEGERVKAQARQAARVRMAERMYKIMQSPPSHNTYVSEKPVFYTPEQMLKDQKEQQS